MKEKDIAAIANALVSVNESDSNGEAANVVDGLFAIARSIRRLAEAIKDSSDPTPTPPN